MVIPALSSPLSSQAMEQKKLCNNLYLYQAITKDVDIGGRTCNHCGLNVHMKCAYRDPDFVETVFWTCLPCLKKKTCAKVPAIDITKNTCEINDDVSVNLIIFPTNSFYLSSN